jgi:hypothetical protein
VHKASFALAGDCARLEHHQVFSAQHAAAGLCMLLIYNPMFAAAGDCARDEHLQVHEQQGALQGRAPQARRLNSHASDGAHQ